MVFNIFYFHPYLGKIPILTNIFQLGWNHQLGYDCKSLLSPLVGQQRVLTKPHSDFIGSGLLARVIGILGCLGPGQGRCFVKKSVTGLVGKWPCLKRNHHFPTIQKLPQVVVPNNFFRFTPKYGEDDSQFDEHIFQMGLKPRTRWDCCWCFRHVVRLISRFLSELFDSLSTGVKPNIDLIVFSNWLAVVYQCL